MPLALELLEIHRDQAWYHPGTFSSYPLYHWTQNCIRNDGASSDDISPNVTTMNTMNNLYECDIDDYQYREYHRYHMLILSLDSVFHLLVPKHFRWHCTDEWDRRAKNKSLAMWVTCKPLEKRTIWKMSTPAMVSVTGIIRDFKIPGHRLSPAFSLPRNRPDKRLTIWIGISNNCWEKTIKKLLNSEIRWKRFAAPEEMPVQTLQMMAIPSGLMATICSSSVVQV